MSIFRDVEAAVTAAADIVCNSGLDIGGYECQAQ